MKAKINLLFLVAIFIISIQINHCFGQSTVLGNLLSGTAPDPNEYIVSSTDGFFSII